MSATLSKPDQAIAANTAQKTLKAAGPLRPEIIANAALMVIQLICFVHEAEKTVGKEMMKAKK